MSFWHDITNFVGYRRWHGKRNKCVGREFQQTSILSKTRENEKIRFLCNIRICFNFTFTSLSALVATSVFKVRYLHTVTTFLKYSTLFYSFSRRKWTDFFSSGLVFTIYRTYLMIFALLFSFFKTQLPTVNPTKLSFSSFIDFSC